MGGEVTWAVRKNGDILVQRIPKGGVLMPWRPGFFDPATEQSGGGPSNRAVAPHDYGLVVVDFDTQWIGSAQGFSDPWQLHTSDIPHRVLEMAQAAREGRLELRVFCERGEGPSRQAIHMAGGVEGEFPDATSLAQAVDQTRKQVWAKARAEGWEPRDYFERIVLAPPAGWIFQVFDDTKQEGWRDMLLQLDERGWSLGAGALQQWRAFLIGKQIGTVSVDALLAQGRQRTLEAAIPESGEVSIGPGKPLRL